MELSSFKEMQKQQNAHWWFQGRKLIIQYFLNKNRSTNKANILEIGCGTGANLALLKTFGNVTAIEMNAYARKQAEHILGKKIINGHLPDNLPLNNEKYNVICLFDVLEHVQKDQESLKILNHYLDDKGYLILTVPAIPMLYSKHDKDLHHFRRYRKKELLILLENANFTVKHFTYFNTLLLPLAFISRVLDKIIPKNKARGSNNPPKFLNQLLLKIFSLELFLIKYIKLPIGLSMLFVMVKNDKNLYRN
jgi:2-polyprenyl-3-methyl-5-hydroxy-6-metoxy-1,4-benzoquinol methylase